MPIPEHVSGLITNMQSIKSLIGIHVRLTGSGPGRRRGVEVLNRAGIVLIVACWEAYVEDLAGAAFDELMRRAKKHTAFPPKVLTSASRALKEDKDDSRVWKLADDGWKGILQNHREALLRKYVGRLNTPKPDQVDLLFEGLVGLKLSNCWTWGNMSATKARETLEQLVSKRGEIAHRVLTKDPVWKRDVREAWTFVNRLMFLSSNAVGDHIYARTRERPWPAHEWISERRRRRSGQTVLTIQSRA